MKRPSPLEPARDLLLFTPGPLTTSKTVKQAMLRDVGSWDREFSEVVADVRRRLLAVAGVQQRQGYEVVPMQGSGSFGLEAVVTSVTPPQGKWLVLINGAYGERIARMAAMQSIAVAPLKCAESQPPTAAEVRAVLLADPAITHIAVVHCETTSGILNPIEPIGHVAKEFGKTFVVDAMSSFGAVPIDLPGAGIDFLVSSSNKCIEGVPGFAFVICRREALEASEGWARSWCMDLLDQWRYMEKTGLFRCTPPTHVVLAFAQALLELEAEGGMRARGMRYRANHKRLVRGMRELGFREFLPEQLQSPIITTFLVPPHRNFEFQKFYDRLHDRGHVIYFGKVTSASCFRIGNIGRIFESDIDDLLGAIARTLREMNVTLLDSCINGRPSPTNGELSASLDEITGQSPQDPAETDPLVASAVKFIQENLHRPIQVAHLIKELRVGRRGLERRFRKTLGRTIAEEIRTIRLDQARRMLRDTAEPISAVATACGYHHPEVLSRGFQRAFGIAPSDFRREYRNEQ